MFLIQQILSQPIIMIIIALIGLLIFIAFAVVVYAQIQQTRRRRARQRERQMQIVTARRAARVASTPLKDTQKKPQPAVIIPPAAAHAVKPAASTLFAPPAANPAAASGSTPPAETSAEDAILSLLTGVFTDDDTVRDQAALLAITEPVDIHDLVVLTQEIAGQLGIKPEGAAV